MTNSELKSAITASADAIKILNQAEHLRRDSRAARETLSQQLDGFADKVSAAEACHASAVACVELHEPGADPAITEAALLGARKAMEIGAPDLRDRLRVVDLILVRLDARCHAHALEVEQAQAGLKAAQIAILEQRAEEIRATAAEMFSGLRDCSSRAVALGGLLSGLGSRWPGAGLVIGQSAEPQQIDVNRFHTALLAEINPA